MSSAATASATLADSSADQRPATFRVRRLVTPHCARCASLRIRLDFSRSGSRRGELAKLSESTGISSSALSHIFAGRFLPSVSNLVLIADALKITESCLLRYPPIWHRLLEEMDQSGA